MTARLMRLVIISLTLPLGALSGCGSDERAEQSAGFAGLGQDADGFQHAAPSQALTFPDDFPQAHAAHPDYRIEWWYLTANLQDVAGEPLGLQWTLFRQALMPPSERPAPTPWAADQLWMAHMAISQGEQHNVAERFGRSHSQANLSQANLSQPHDAQAGVVAAPFHAWLDDWQLQASADADDDAFSPLTLTAYSGEGASRFGYTLELTAEGPLVLHGEEGFSQKAANGQGSMYYSQPFWQIEGDVTLNGETKAVSGRGWLDREWSSQLLDARQSGWDWFSIHLDDGHKLMAFQLRGGGDTAQNADYRSGTWITPQGDATPLTTDDITMTPLATSAVAGRDVPTRWRLEIPSVEIDAYIEAPHANRWMDTSVPYWEGEVVATDRASGESMGEGYLEMTGY